MFMKYIIIYIIIYYLNLHGPILRLVKITVGKKWGKLMNHDRE